MIDPATASNLVTINKPDGTARHLKKCGPSDWMKLANTFRHTRKVWKMVSMSGQPQEAIQAEMDKLDKQRIFYSDVAGFFDHPEGQYEAILLSLAKDNPKATRKELEADFDTLGLEFHQWMVPACALFNVPMEPPTKKNIPENQGDGATTNPTGDEPPTSSGTTSASGPPTP